ncbi:MAG: TIGR00282 family metallophosphoesterase [Thermoanaerobaculaceae bacterium]|nr:TIGR00282 family metallophosphoesterase [Thermoanaerobaculaceae bacterium]MDI9622445.1 TIGR00282 family metallophosphoesterase [Acidobacteriota bacterium]NLH11200.1 TIGR00282 family metallophosphoesterase [Holophagae bacterium]HPW54346.1 TIGR00282 family metallophosphoesterase [Thermoanaerobaculaceae bacterium]
MLRILFVGDVVGKVGRQALSEHLRRLQGEVVADLTVVNVENAAGGFGVTDTVWSELRRLPVDVFTTGNHVWDKRETLPLLDTEPRLLRPANYPAGNPGRGMVTVPTAKGVPVTVINLQGLTFMSPIECPFRVADRLLAELGAPNRVVVVDMHAEATSEKQALAWYLDGRVSAVLGTHTHVPTADERVLPKGTAAITDVGMTGAYEGIIGFKPRPILERFLYATPRAFETATGGGALCGVVVDVDEQSGLALRIERVRREGGHGQ